MFRRSGKSSKSDKLREKQIDGLIHLSNVSAVPGTPNSYDASFTSGAFGKQSFRIELPQNFPERAPILRFTTPVEHAWLDSSMMIVGYGKLRSWSVHMSLKNVVQELCMEFARSPPRPGGQQRQYSGYPAGQQQLAYNYGAKPGPAQPVSYQYPGPAQPQPVAQPPQQSYQSQPKQAQPPSYSYGLQVPAKSSALAQPVSPPSSQENFHVPKIPIPSKFEKVESFSLEELQDFMSTASDPQSVDDFVEGLPAVKNLMEIRDDLQTSVMGRAGRSLANREEFNTLLAEVEALNLEVQKKEEVFRDLKERENKISNRYSPAIIRNLLSEKADLEREQSDEIKEKYGDEEMGTAKFIKDFRKSRQKFHFLKGKEERLSQIHALQIR